MNITELNGGEKSYLIRETYSRAKNLMFPLVGLARNEEFNPNAYLYWNGEESIENFELITFYNKIRNEGRFRMFEKDRVLINKMLKACYTVKGGQVYIYDLIKYADDVANLLDGRYSRFKEESKKMIRKYHGDNYNGEPVPNKPFHMILYPEKYFEVVAINEGIPLDSLKKVGELWDRFKKEGETLDVDIINDCQCVIPETLMLNM